MALFLTIGAAAGAGLTKSQHQAEAARHEECAVDFAMKAAKHEETAARIQGRQGYNAMQHKWPGLANGPLNLARDRAMQARRAEAECRAQAAHHRNSAGETAAAGEQ